MKRQRVGNFWLDALNFVRVTDSAGWSFNALVVFVDDLVVYPLTSGQPRITESAIRCATRSVRCRRGATS